MSPKDGHESRRTEGEPHDRLTGLCAAMATALEADPSYVEKSDRAVVFLYDGKRAGIGIHGYKDDDMHMVHDVLRSLRVIANQNGEELLVVPLAGGPDS